VPIREPRPDVEMVQLATRIPQGLLQRVRVWAINSDTSIMAFVETAIREALEQSRAKQR
jgi:predicted HicB family RNase H-like nuclease